MTRPLTQEPPAQKIEPRQRALSRHNRLVQERSSWVAMWIDINDYVLPRRLRYFQNERNFGPKYKYSKIINNTATAAARTLSAGKMAGQTPPSRPWFHYTITDPAIIGDSECLQWVATVEKIVNEVFHRSNLYLRIHELWFLQGAFGTSVLYVEEDEEDDVRAFVFPLGQYCLASSGKGRVDTISRQFEMTVEQLVTEFGLDNCSEPVKIQYRDGNYDSWIKVMHQIHPNVNRQTGKIDNGNMPFVSEWWEVAAPADHIKPLRKTGYEEQPFVVARWEVIGEDIYGSGCPGMDSLGDNKGMQQLEKRKAEGVDKAMRPPMKAPVSAKTMRLSYLPGDTSYVDESAQGAKLTPSYEVKGDQIAVAKDSVKDHEERINRAFYVHLFFAMLMRQDQGVQPRTAEEIKQMYGEKMLMLGPVVERDNDEVLDPLHDRMVRILARRGKLPPMPQKMQGRSVKIEYTSIMAQAQKLLGTAAIERFTSYIGSTSAINKDILDIPNWDKLIKNYAEALGIKADEINPDEMIQAMRQQRAQQQAQAQQMAQLQQGAEAAKAAGAAQITPDNLLGRLMDATGGGGRV